MADTSLSPQSVLNRLYGASFDTQYSEQAIANLSASQPLTKDSWQTVLNRNLGTTNLSIQAGLHQALASTLGLAGGPTELSIQALLNRAYSAGATLSTVMGTSSGGGASTGQPIGLLLALTQP